MTHGTDTHVLLVDLRPRVLKGMQLKRPWNEPTSLAIKTVCLLILKSQLSHLVLRLGSPAGTTRGFGKDDFRQIGRWIIEVVDGLALNGEEGNHAVEEKVKSEVAILCAKYPLYPNL